MKPYRNEILGAFYDNLSMSETIHIISKTIKERKQIHHVVINAGKIVSMRNNEGLKKSVNEADIINVDGQAVVWAAKILNKPIKERVAGIDLFENLIELAHANGYKIFLLGAKEAIVREVNNKIIKKYSPYVISGYLNGYFLKDEEHEVVSKIIEAEPNMLFVAMPSPQKEIFLYKHKEDLKNVNFIMGVGGSFDVIAGLSKRAPIWMQKMGLEWFYRFIQEPKRLWKRYLIGNSKFIYYVIKDKFSF